MSKTAEFRSIVESMDSPLLNDVTQPMSRIVAQVDKLPVCLSACLLISLLVSLLAKHIMRAS
jgi:hypothetical protein